MTTQHDHSPYLDQLDDPQAFWEQRIKCQPLDDCQDHRLGVLAALGHLGRDGWKTLPPSSHHQPELRAVAGHYLLLLLIFLLWAAALLQKSACCKTASRA
jgi:hypothetical protein